jgi:hypothetical protein
VFAADMRLKAPAMPITAHTARLGNVVRRRQVLTPEPGFSRLRIHPRKTASMLLPSGSSTKAA